MYKNDYKYIYIVYIIPLTAHDASETSSADDDGTDTVRRQATANEEITHAYIYTYNSYITIPELNYNDIYTVLDSIHYIHVCVYINDPRGTHTEWFSTGFILLLLCIPLNYSNRKCPRPSTAAHTHTHTRSV